MPTSKKPRKKGKHGRDMDAMRAARKGTYRNDAHMKQVYRTLSRKKRHVKSGASLFAWMNDLADPDTLLSYFAQAFFALKRWRETEEIGDFNCVSQLLMIGAMLHKEMKVQEGSLLRDIRNAAFLTICCVRLRNFDHEVPEANIEAVHSGLVTAHELAKFAAENPDQRNTLLNVIRQNLPDFVAARPGLREQRERFILGDKYDIVQKWIREDPLGKFTNVELDELDKLVMELELENE